VECHRSPGTSSHFAHPVVGIPYYGVAIANTARARTWNIQSIAQGEGSDSHWYGDEIFISGKSRGGPRCHLIGTAQWASPVLQEAEKLQQSFGVILQH
jgi:hypothetical protein